MSLPDLRVGNGLDVHAFCRDKTDKNKLVGDRVVLGGVTIPSDGSLEGHSDADVLIHAIMDAILGAAALGDIGQHFPPDDDAYAGARSTLLLEQVMQMVRAEGWELVNVDSVVFAQAPRLAPYIMSMRTAIAEAASVDQSRVAVKATTAEAIGFVGRLEGIAALTTVLLAKG